MSVRYQAVNWNPAKKRYDLVLVVAILAMVGGFTTVSLSRPHATLETALIRALGTTAFALLTFILCIGPLARLDHRFNALLYNRRHLGVTMALLGLGHAIFALLQYHGGGAVFPLTSLMQGAPTTKFPAEFPFEWLGLAALLILVVMAATSHDYWLSVLSPRAWKTLHMMVYVAFGLLVLHVALGELQSEGGTVADTWVLGSAVLVFGLHAVSGLREWRRDALLAAQGNWVDAGAVGDIAEGRAIGAIVRGERVAIFRHNDRLSCVSGVCRHQNGPLAEGRIIDGCITCPWHGYQYLPENGTSPPPYDDRIATYNLKIENGRVLVQESANAPGTRIEAIPVVSRDSRLTTRDSFYVGYLPAEPAIKSFLRTRVPALLLAGLGLTLILAFAQKPPASSSYEYGIFRTYQGTLIERPYPMLVTTDSGETRTWLLAAELKRGADSLAQGFDGQIVSAEGSLIQRGSHRMIEVRRVNTGSGQRQDLLRLSADPPVRLS
ncbi:MAG TPA: Rieske 2Fe-2S domain-containing protein, partial [Gemmatimonadales bacterium]|nr:Rieske 2Fe-2S domain-containing protein [Gemmatimonadales bacterium]